MLPFPVDAHPPLHGVRVLDAARVLAGPFCGQLLADLGADVVKLERPGAGDDTRGWGPPYLDNAPDLSAYFLSCNRGKRSLTLDIAKPEGNVVFHKLLAKSDVLIENFRTDSAEKLGLTPEDLAREASATDRLLHQRIRPHGAAEGRAGLRLRHPGDERPHEHHRPAGRTALQGGRGARGRAHRPVRRRPRSSLASTPARPAATATPSIWACSTARWRRRSTSPRPTSRAVLSPNARGTHTCRSCRTSSSRRRMAISS